MAQVLVPTQCLDDIDRLIQDNAFQALCDDKAYTAKSIADFLRSFSNQDCKELNKRLVTLSLKLRALLFPEEKEIIIDIDSTHNQQYGKKMEGVVRNYKGFDSLETLHAFCEKGMPLWIDVRPGNTHTAKSSEEVVHHIFSNMPKTKHSKRIRKIVRADRGYCKISLFNACEVKGAKFVIGARYLLMMPLIPKVTQWKTQNPNKKNRIMAKGPRECEIGETLYYPKQSDRVLRVVMIRAVKKGHEVVLFKQEDDYDYYGWITNMGAHEMSGFEVINCYRKRGGAESYIKEAKNGMDLHHYPCEKLTANKAYGVIAAFAMTIMRYVALKDSPKKPQFSKAIRFRLIDLPCQVVRHAREVTFKFMDHHYTEVQRWLRHVKTLQHGFA